MTRHDPRMDAVLRTKTIVKNLPPPRAGVRGTGSKYDVLLDGRVHKLVHTTFTAKDAQMIRSRLYTTAKKHGLKVQIRWVEEEHAIYVQALPVNGK